ncbi:MAG: addiction module antidote protein [Endomicrobiales bacterium]
MKNYYATCRRTLGVDRSAVSINRHNFMNIMKKRKVRTLNDVEIEYFEKHPKEIKQYLEVALEEYQKDGNEKVFLASLAVIAKVKGRFSKVSKETGLNREHLYRALSKEGDPKFSTVMQVLHSLGLSLKVA